MILLGPELFKNQCQKSLMAKLLVRVIKEKCIACGACVAIAPEIFQFGSDGKSEPKLNEITDPELIQKAKEAKESCPTGAIEIEEQ